MKFWVPLVRGILAITLGTALLLQPDKTRPVLANFMGMYWLVSGVISLRWGVPGEQRQRRLLLIGIVSILAGAGMLTRRAVMGWIVEDVVLSLIGLIVMLTGILRMFGDPEQRRFLLARRRPQANFLLGLFEFILGLILVVSPLGRGPVVFLAAAAWAFLGGLILIGEAMRVRKQATLAIETSLSAPEEDET